MSKRGLLAVLCFWIGIAIFSGLFILMATHPLVGIVVILLSTLVIGSVSIYQLLK